MTKIDTETLSRRQYVDHIHSVAPSRGQILPGQRSIASINNQFFLRNAMQPGDKTKTNEPEEELTTFCVEPATRYALAHYQFIPRSESLLLVPESLRVLNPVVFLTFSFSMSAFGRRLLFGPLQYCSLRCSPSRNKYIPGVGGKECYRNRSRTFTMNWEKLVFGHSTSFKNSQE